MSHSNTDPVRLRRMLAATSEASELVQRAPLDVLAADRTACLALERLLQVLADQAHGVGHIARDRHRAVPWDRLDQLRETVDTSHERIDPRVLYAVVVREGPPLLEALRAVVPSDDE